MAKKKAVSKKKKIVAKKKKAPTAAQKSSMIKFKNAAKLAKIQYRKKGNRKSFCTCMKEALKK